MVAAGERVKVGCVWCACTLGTRSCRGVAGNPGAGGGVCIELGAGGGGNVGLQTLDAADTVNIMDTQDTADTVDIMDTLDTADTVDIMDTLDTEDTLDIMDTLDIVDTVEVDIMDTLV